MGTCSRQPSDEELFALETIIAAEDVASYRWLEEGSDPTPDLEVTLNDGRIVAVEITMSTDGAGRSLFASFDGKRWRRTELTREWVVALVDRSPKERGRRRNVEALIDRLVPVLQDVEAQGGEPQPLIQRANSKVAWFASPEWDRVEVVGFDPSGEDTCGGVLTLVVAVNGGLMKSVEALVPAVQQRIDAKIAKGQLDGFPSPTWLVVVIDGGMSAMALNAAFGSEDGPQWPAGTDAVTFAGVDEVWVIGNRAGRSIHRGLLRLTALGDRWKWRVVQIESEEMAAAR